MGMNSLKFDASNLSLPENHRKAGNECLTPMILSLYNSQFHVDISDLSNHFICIMQLFRCVSNPRSLFGFDFFLFCSPSEFGVCALLG